MQPVLIFPGLRRFNVGPIRRNAVSWSRRITIETIYNGPGGGRDVLSYDISASDETSLRLLFELLQQLELVELKTEDYFDRPILAAGLAAVIEIMRVRQ